MKKIFLLLISISSVAYSHAQFTSAKLQASGLTCAMCSRAIDNALRQLPFVESVKPDIQNSLFTIHFKAGDTANIDAVKQAVEDAGFFVSRLTITGSFNHTAIRNDEHVSIGGSEFHFVQVNDQVLDGEKSLVVVDKNFLSPAAFKKFSTATAMPCIKTGRAAACCTKTGLAVGTRIYHVTI